MCGSADQIDLCSLTLQAHLSMGRDCLGNEEEEEEKKNVRAFILLSRPKTFD